MGMATRCSVSHRIPSTKLRDSINKTLKYSSTLTPGVVFIKLNSGNGCFCRPKVLAQRYFPRVQPKLKDSCEIQRRQLIIAFVVKITGSGQHYVLQTFVDTCPHGETGKSPWAYLFLINHTHVRPCSSLCVRCTVASGFLIHNSGCR